MNPKRVYDWSDHQLWRRAVVGSVLLLCPYMVKSDSMFEDDFSAGFVSSWTMADYPVTWQLT